MYAVQDKAILNVEIIETTNRGTGAWCKIEGVDGKKIVSLKKIFESKEKALAYINKKNHLKELKEIRNAKFASKYEKETELLDKYWFCMKMINRGEATEEELKPQLDEIEKELSKERKKIRGGKLTYKDEKKTEILDNCWSDLKMSDSGKNTSDKKVKSAINAEPMLTIENFVKENISNITKEQIKKVYDTLDIPCESLRTKKNELLLELQYDNIAFNDIYNIVKDEQFGISVTATSEKLGITKYRVNKLIDNNTFKVIYERVNQKYGKTIYCKFLRYEDVYNYYLENLKKSEE